MWFSDANEYPQTSWEKCVKTNESHLVGRLCVGEQIALKSQGELSRKWAWAGLVCHYCACLYMAGLLAESHSNLHLVLEQIALYPIKSCGPCKVYYVHIKIIYICTVCVCVYVLYSSTCVYAHVVVTIAWSSEISMLDLFASIFLDGFLGRD